MFTPTQTGMGEREHLITPETGIATFIQDIVNVIESEELSGVILVGHSFGGLAITGTADGLSNRIRHAPEAFGVTEPAALAWLKRRLTPHPAKTYQDPIELRKPAAHGLKRTFIRCTKPLYAPLNASAERAKKMGNWNILEIATAHNAMVTVPDELSQMLLNVG